MLTSFNKGDIVRVRTISSMTAEFGSTSGGYPNVLYGWSQSMTLLCGELAEVTHDSRHSEDPVRLKAVNPTPLRTTFEQWSWSSGMLESATRVSKYPSNYAKAKHAPV